MSFRGVLGGGIIVSSILITNLLETNEKTDQAEKTRDESTVILK